MKLSRQESQQNQNSSERKENLKIFLNCLPQSLTEEIIILHFSKFGNIKTFKLDQAEKIPLNNFIHTNGILTCADQKTKEEILKKEQHQIGEFKINAKNYLSKEELENIYDVTKKRRIYIKKLPESFDNEKLKKFLSCYGEVEKSYCVYGTKKKRRKGLKYGYAIFRDQKSLKNLPGEGFPFEGKLIKWHCYEKKPKAGKDQKHLIKDGEDDSRRENQNKKIPDSRKNFRRHFHKPGSVLYHILNSGNDQYKEKDLQFHLSSEVMTWESFIHQGVRKSRNMSNFRHRLFERAERNSSYYQLF